MLSICADCLPFCVRSLMYFAFAQSYLTHGIECWGNTISITPNIQFHLLSMIVQKQNTLNFLHKKVCNKHICLT